ncbi:MAG: BPL-N domain-containing protein [Promethearchaeota archaeon]
MKEMHSQRMQGMCMLSIMFLILLSPTPSVAQVEHDDLTGVKVAVYNGAGVMNSSRIALTRMFEWMNATVVEVNASQILNDFLDDCDILVIPGGAEGTCARELQYLTGVNKVKEFVEKGGSFFGICGGATYGANYVKFFNGSMNPVSEPGSLIHVTTMNVNQFSTGPDLSDCPTDFSTMYYGSQYFVPREGTDVHIIATYDYNGEAGMVAFEYENGTVFLSSPHPEYEEDSNRDDTTDYDYLDDPDSEWDILFRVSKWLIEASYVEQSSPSTTPTYTSIPLDLPLIATALAGGIVVVLIVAAFYRRMH